MIRKTFLIALLAAFALLLAFPLWSGPIPASIVPEGARWIAHLDMEKFVATDLFKYLDKDGRFDLRVRDVERWFKIDAARDITGVTLFGLGPDDDDAVFAVAGKFDKARLMALLELNEDHKEIAYGAFTIHAMDADEYGAFVNDNLIVFSSHREAIEKALDAAGGKAKTFASSKLAASLKGVPAGAFLSGVVEDLSGLGREINQSKLVEKASGLFFMAQEKQSVLQMRVQMEADTAENSKNIADLVQGLIALGRLSEGRGGMAEIASLAERIRVKQDGKTVWLEFEGPSREIADLIGRGRGFSAWLR
jgi:hypothetical protein